MLQVLLITTIKIEFRLHLNGYLHKHGLNYISQRHTPYYSKLVVVSGGIVAFALCCIEVRLVILIFILANYSPTLNNHFGVLIMNEFVYNWKNTYDFIRILYVSTILMDVNSFTIPVESAFVKSRNNEKKMIIDFDVVF